MAVRVYQNGQVLSTVTGSSLVSALSPHTLMTWLSFLVWPYSVRTSMVGLYGPSSGITTAIQIGQSIGGVGDIHVWTWGGTSLISTGGSFTFTTNEWYHVAYTYDGTNHRLYINGSLINTTTTSQQSGTYDLVFINGYPTGGNSESGNFQVDDVIVFNRQLSQPEIQTIYVTRGLADNIAYNCLCRYSFDEGVINSNVVQCSDTHGHPPTLNLTPKQTGTTPIYVNSIAARNYRPPLG